MRRLPLFVLPIVLLPRSRVPLHVFEPRYRQMVARCLEFDKRFGLLFHRNDLYGPFRVEPGRVGCVAEIGEFRPLPDGRSLMMARGVERFLVADSVESEALYYEALVEEYRDEDESAVELVARRQRSIQLFEALLKTLPEPLPSPLGLDAERETSFDLAATIEIDPAWQQGLLELQRESGRLERIDHVLRLALDARLGRRN